MQVGLLWFDNNPARGLTAKIEDAAQRYREKFGVTPDTCYVNQSALTLCEQSLQDSKLHIVPAGNILLHHFWIGIEEKKD